MREGRWLAQSNLKNTAHQGSKYDWHYGTPYRLRLEMIVPPSNEDLTLARYRRILSHLEPADLSEGSGDVTTGVWDISGEDIWGDLMGEKRSSRLLGHFSLHGVELVLERDSVVGGLEQPT